MGKAMRFPNLLLAFMSTNYALSQIHHTHQSLENTFNETEMVPLL